MSNVVEAVETLLNRSKKENMSTEEKNNDDVPARGGSNNVDESDDLTQAEIRYNGLPIDDMRLYEIKAALEKLGVAFKKTDKKSILEALLRETLANHDHSASGHGRRGRSTPAPASASKARLALRGKSSPPVTNHSLRSAGYSLRSRDDSHTRAEHASHAKVSHLAEVSAGHIKANAATAPPRAEPYEENDSLFYSTKGGLRSPSVSSRRSRARSERSTRSSRTADGSDSEADGYDGQDSVVKVRKAKSSETPMLEPKKARATPKPTPKSQQGKGRSSAKRETPAVVTQEEASQESEIQSVSDRQSDSSEDKKEEKAGYRESERVSEEPEHASQEELNDSHADFFDANDGESQDGHGPGQEEQEQVFEEGEEQGEDVEEDSAEGSYGEEEDSGDDEGEEVMVVEIGSSGEESEGESQDEESDEGSDGSEENEVEDGSNQNSDSNSEDADEDDEEWPFTEPGEAEVVDLMESSSEEEDEYKPPIFSSSTPAAITASVPAPSSTPTASASDSNTAAVPQGDAAFQALYEAAHGVLYKNALSRLVAQISPLGKAGAVSDAIALLRVDGYDQRVDVITTAMVLDIYELIQKSFSVLARIMSAASAQLLAQPTLLWALVQIGSCDPILYVEVNIQRLREVMVRFPTAFSAEQLSAPGGVARELYDALHGGGVCCHSRWIEVDDLNRRQFQLTFNLPEAMHRQVRHAQRELGPVFMHGVVKMDVAIVRKKIKGRKVYDVVPYSDRL